MSKVRCPHHPDVRQSRSVLFEVIDGTLTPVVCFDECRDRVPGLVEAQDVLPPTVARLRAALDRFPDDAFVVLGKDSEGNGVSPFHAADVKHYLPATPGSGELVGRDEPGAVEVLVLWPTE